MGTLLDSLHRKYAVKHAAGHSKASRHVLNFLAHKDEVEEAMREGWTVKQVWEQMTEDGMTSMSYANLCRLVKKHIIPSPSVVDVTIPLVDVSSSPSSKVEKPRDNKPAKKSKRPEKKLTEKERLDLLREEAFASVRSRKTGGSLIENPKSREEERRELFGE